MRIKRTLFNSIRGELIIDKQNIVTGFVEHYHMHNLIVTNFASKFCNGTNANFLTTSSGEGASPAGLVVGDGSDVPSSSDTKLTNQLFSTTCTSAKGVVSQDCQTVTATLLFTLPATSSYVGNLRECGLTAGGTLITHSLFEDAEGNPITIEKTDLDEITVTYIVYISSSGKAGAVGIVGSNGINCFAGNISYSWTWGTNYAYMRLSMKKFLLSYDADYIYSRNSYQAELAQAGPDAGFLAFPVTRFVQNHAFNGHFVQALLIYGQAGRDWMPLDAINLPDTDVMIQATLKDYAIGTGDGETTDFIAPIPAWLKNSEQIFIDEGVLTRGVDYTCDNLHNLKNNPELFPLFHANIISGNVGSVSEPYISRIYMVDNGSEVSRINNNVDNTTLIGYASLRNTPYNRTQLFMTNSHPFIFELMPSDNLISRAFDTVYLFTRYDNVETAANYDIVTIEASDDLDTWDSVLLNVSGYKTGRGSDSPTGVSLSAGWVKYELDTPVDKKYIRVSVKMKNSSTSYNSYHDVFGLILKHGGSAIHFTNAPAQDAKITMSCAIDRIWKDDQHVADITATYTV